MKRTKASTVSRVVTMSLLLYAPLARAQDTTANRERLGRIYFAVSCASDTQAQFNRAVAMLHNFWHPQSLNTFTEIAARDAGCAMAYWGIAMSLRANPLVGAPDSSVLRRGHKVLERAKGISATTQRERDYIAALETYYLNWDTLDHRDRVLKYETAMEQLHLRYPDDQEAAVLYALALNEGVTVQPADKRYARQIRAAQLLEKVLAAQPGHPGALHYLIHSYDFPLLAARALPAAHQYSAAAPSAPHALHMPSHVFSMLGMWHESIRSNQAALDLARTYVHAIDFMTYAYLQMAQDADAKRLVDESRALQAAQEPATERTPTGGVLAVYTAYAAIPARYAIERRAWDEALALDVRSTYPAADAITYFTRAVAAARSGKLARAGPDIERLRLLSDLLRQARDDYWSEQVDIQEIAAQAWLTYAEGRTDAALLAMRAAADREDASEKHVAMENRLWPMRELLGEMLLDANEPEQALHAFEMSLTVAPNRFRSFSGAAMAAEQLGDREKAKAYYRKLLALCGQTCGDRPELTRARAALTKADSLGSPGSF